MLNQYWLKKRVLIAFSLDTQFYETIKLQLSASLPELLDRDMIILGFGKGLNTFYVDPLLDLEQLRRSLSIEENTLVLIGKDGTVKASWTEPVKIKTIFEIIDAMPMRKREIREKRGL